MDFLLWYYSQNLIGCSFIKVTSETVWMNFYHYIKIRWSTLCFDDFVTCVVGWKILIRGEAHFHILTHFIIYYAKITFVNTVDLISKDFSIGKLSGSQWRICFPRFQVSLESLKSLIVNKVLFSLKWLGHIVHFQENTCQIPTPQ